MLTWVSISTFEMKPATLSRLSANAPVLSTESLVPLLCWPLGFSSEVLKFGMWEGHKMRVSHLTENIINVKVSPALQKPSSEVQNE